jgi:hypothetical protein
MAERAGLFEGDDFDVSGFTPKKPVKQEQPEPEAVRAVSETANFRSREPVQAKPAKKADRRYRTGRNIQLNTKVTAETEKLLYAIYDAHKGKENWTLGQIIGFGLEALKRELAAKGKS